MHPYLKPVSRQFEKNSDATVAAWAKAYLKDQFEHFGLPTPLRRAICKEHFKSSLPDYNELPAIVTDAWEQPQREFHYLAVELIAAMKKSWKPPVITVAEYMITHKSWWDTVDHVASEITGPYFKIFPQETEKITSKWNQSTNIWLQRSSIMFQKAYKSDTSTVLLSKYILNCSTSDEFFVQKAIGWALREYSKSNPKWVTKFVRGHNLPKLSKKEALRRIIN